MNPNERPFFSVIIPTYNRWPLVGEAIDSVLSQTYDSYELIVVDDGSDDGTAERIMTNYPGLKLLGQPNMGVSAARNTGIAAARGEWVAFLDSDDLWTENKLFEQRAAIKTDPSMLALHNDEIWIRNGKRVNPGKKHVKMGSRHGGFDTLFDRSVSMCLISPSSVALHHSVFKEVGTFDESLPVCEDYDMWLRIMIRLPVDYLPEKLTVKRNGEPGCEAEQLSQRWGMDRYRILSLEKLLDSPHLPIEKRFVVLEEIVRKARIVADGADKRGDGQEAATWREKETGAARRLAEL